MVTGAVYDTSKNNRSLPEAAIKSTDTPLLTTTDRNGKYKLKLTPDRQILRANFLGYLLTSTKTLNLLKGDSVIIDFVLKDAIKNL